MMKFVNQLCISDNQESTVYEYFFNIKKIKAFHDQGVDTYLSVACIITFCFGSSPLHCFSKMYTY